MTHHPTEPAKVAQGGSETAETDILARAHSIHGSSWFLPGGEVNLPAVLEASNVIGDLAAEVERLRGALKSVEQLAEDWLGSKAWDERPSIATRAFGHTLQAVLRGDQ